MCDDYQIKLLTLKHYSSNVKSKNRLYRYGIERPSGVTDRGGWWRKGVGVTGGEGAKRT